MTELIQDTRVVVIAVIAVIAARPKDQEQQQQLHGISREFTSAPSGESSSSKLNERTNVSISDHSIPLCHHKNTLNPCCHVLLNV